MVFQSIFDQSRVVALDCQTGDLRWSYQTGGWILGSAAVTERSVVVGSQDGSVYCLDKQAGTVNWRFPTKSRVESTPAIAGDGVCVPSCDGRMYCIDLATGGQNWSYATEPPPGKTKAIYCHPIVTEDAVYFTAGEGQLYGVERASGKLLFRIRPSDGSELFSSPSTDGRRIFVTTRAQLDQTGEGSVVAGGPWCPDAG